MDLPVFEPMPMPVCGTRSKDLKRRDKLALRKKYGKKKVGRPNTMARFEIVELLEDYFANDYTIRGLAYKYKIHEVTVNSYIARMFGKRPDETTIVLILKSKV